MRIPTARACRWVTTSVHAATEGTASGMVLCKAAELARERLAHLVFVDALALLPGEQVGSIVHRAAPTATSALATGPTQADAEQRLFADLPPALRAWALA